MPDLRTSLVSCFWPELFFPEFDPFSMACYNSVRVCGNIRETFRIWHLKYNSSSYKELSGQEVLMPTLIKLLILKSFDSYNIFFKKSKTLFLYLQNAFSFVCSGCLKPRSTAGFNLSLISDVPYRFLLCIFSFWIIQRHDFFSYYGQ